MTSHWIWNKFSSVQHWGTRKANYYMIVCKVYQSPDGYVVYVPSNDSELDLLPTGHWHIGQGTLSFLVVMVAILPFFRLSYEGNWEAGQPSGQGCMKFR